MPLEGLEEEGLPKNPDIHLAQLKFLLTVEEGVDREAVWGELIAAIKENSEKCLPHFRLTFRPSPPPLFDLCAKTRERMNHPHTYPTTHLHTHTSTIHYPTPYTTHTPHTQSNGTILQVGMFGGGSSTGLLPPS